MSLFPVSRGHFAPPYTPIEKYPNLSGSINNNILNYINKDDNLKEYYNNCTDGKDDGKIGVFCAIDNFIKGFTTSLKSGLKSLYTDKNGNFSISKSILTFATASLCISVPAIGLAACILGGVSGGIKIYKGIKTASKAQTDSVKKQSFQNIGEGTFGVTVAAFGAKSSINAIKSYSSASASNLLAENAGIIDKLKAFASDSINSTKEAISVLPDVYKAQFSRFFGNKSKNIHPKHNTLHNKVVPYKRNNEISSDITLVQYEFIPCVKENAAIFYNTSELYNS